MGPAPRILIELLSNPLEGTWQTLAVSYGLACRKHVRGTAPLLGIHQKLVVMLRY